MHLPPFMKWCEPQWVKYFMLSPFWGEKFQSHLFTVIWNYNYNITWCEMEGNEHDNHSLCSCMWQYLLRTYAPYQWDVIKENYSTPIQKMRVRNWCTLRHYASMLQIGLLHFNPFMIRRSGQCTNLITNEIIYANKNNSWKVHDWECTEAGWSWVNVWFF